MKLSPRMVEALKNINQYGEYELWELSDWHLWNAVKGGQGAPIIRTDTMKGLIKRNLVQEKYDKKRPLWKWTAMLTDSGKNILLKI